LNKSILLLKIILENTQTLHSKLKRKVFTKVIKMPSKEAWVYRQTESNQKRGASALIETGIEELS